MSHELERLRQRTADIQAELAKEREKNKPSIHENMITEAKAWLDRYDFWCEKCQEDFTAKAMMTTHRLYGEPVAVYRAYHEECGEEAVRLITHRDHDLYYYLSEKVHIQRNQYRQDLLQSEEFGFETFYGKPYKGFEERLQKSEEKRFLKNKQAGLGGII